MFSMQHRAPGVLELPGLDVTPLGQELALTKFDLNLTAIEAGSELVLRWHYATSIFEHATIERMAAAFEVLLRGIVSTPEQPVYALPLVTEVVRSKGESIDRTNTPCVHVAFEAQAAQTPDSVAVAYNVRNLTYRELNDQPIAWLTRCSRSSFPPAPASASTSSGRPRCWSASSASSRRG